MLSIDRDARHSMIAGPWRATAGSGGLNARFVPVLEEGWLVYHIA
jgi:hypothetical protein